MLLLLLTFKNNHGDVTALLRLNKFLLDLAHEADIDVDVLVWLKLALQGSDCEHLLGASLLHAEVEADGVLSLILQIQRQLLGLSNADGSEVEFGLHAIVQGDVEGFRVDVNRLLLLLDAVAFDVFNLKLDVLKELLLTESIE